MDNTWLTRQYGCTAARTCLFISMPLCGAHNHFHCRSFHHLQSVIIVALIGPLGRYSVRSSCLLSETLCSYYDPVRSPHLLSGEHRSFPTNNLFHCKSTRGFQCHPHSRQYPSKESVKGCNLSSKCSQVQQKPMTIWRHRHCLRSVGIYLEKAKKRIRGWDMIGFVFFFNISDDFRKSTSKKTHGHSRYSLMSQNQHPHPFGPLFKDSTPKIRQVAAMLSSVICALWSNPRSRCSWDTSSVFISRWRG